MIKINGAITQTSSIQGNISRENLKGTSKTIEEVSGSSEKTKEIQGSGKIPEYFIKDEADPTVPEHVKKITKEDIEKWNNPDIPEVDNNYNNATNKPSINGVELVGNKTAEDLNLQPKGNYANKEDVEDFKKAKFIIKEYATYNDLPKPLISYTYSNVFNYQWGPPEDYYRYVDGKWVADVESVYVSVDNLPYPYTQEDFANVTCKITGELPTDLYPDITEDSLSLIMSYVDISPSYILASYFPVLTTSYGDYEHNPWVLDLSLSFDLIFPLKLNSEIAEDVIYKVLDTNKCYILDTETYEWVEFDESVLNLIPVMNFIDRMKQDKLVSGENIATINDESLLTGGNLSLATYSNLSSYLLKTYVRDSRSTASNGYTYDVRYINNMIKTSRTTSSYNTYDCTYINSLIKTSKQSSDNYTYGCNYIDNNFLTLDTLPRWDGGNQ